MTMTLLLHRSAASVSGYLMQQTMWLSTQLSSAEWRSVFEQLLLSSQKEYLMRASAYFQEHVGAHTREQPSEILAGSCSNWSKKASRTRRFKAGC